MYPIAFYLVDAVPNSYQAATTTSDNAPMEREHLQANIKQENDAEDFGAEGLSDGGESLRTSSVSSEGTSFLLNQTIHI